MEVYEFMKDKINEFEKKRKDSPFCRLSLANGVINWNNFSRNDSLPFAFILFLDNALDKIDSLLYKYDIEHKATEDFKNRLKERSVLSFDTVEEFKYLKNTKGVLVELLVADYLEQKGEGMRELAALVKHPIADIKTKVANLDYFTEVKYIGPHPELYHKTVEQIRDGKSPAGWIDSLENIYNYINIRIADAVYQLNNKEINLEQRRVILVLESKALMPPVDDLLNKTNWRTGGWDMLCEKLKVSQGGKKYLEKSVADFHNEANVLLLMSLNISYDILPVVDLSYQKRQNKFQY